MKIGRHKQPGFVIFMAKQCMIVQVKSMKSSSMIRGKIADHRSAPKDEESIPPEIREEYQEVTQYHHKLLERLARK